MIQTLIKRAIQEAKKSKLRYKVGAVIFKHSKILSTGHNSIRYHSKLHPRFKKHIQSLCAEKAAILSAKKDLRGCSLLVIRISLGNKLKMAYPCPSCHAYIEYVGISKIYYSTNDSEIVLDSYLYV